MRAKLQPPLEERDIARIEIGEHAFLAMTPDPLVLFPGAGISCSTDINLRVRRARPYGATGAANFIES